VPHDDQIAKLEENKHRWSWLALRTARDQYLAHFGKIGTGDIVQLALEIEKEARAERDQEKGAKSAAGDSPVTLMVNATGTGEERAISPAALSKGGNGAGGLGKAEEKIGMRGQSMDSEGDVKMDEHS